MQLHKLRSQQRHGTKTRSRDKRHEWRLDDGERQVVSQSALRPDCSAMSMSPAGNPSSSALMPSLLVTDGLLSLGCALQFMAIRLSFVRYQLPASF